VCCVECCFGTTLIRATVACQIVKVAAQRFERIAFALDLGRRLSHTMDPRRGAPLASSPASVTVVAPTCAEADAWATALMVAGADAGTKLAASHDLNALFLLRDGDGGLHTRTIGRLFGSEATAAGGGQA
jgi:hypothetical protein